MSLQALLSDPQAAVSTLPRRLTTWAGASLGATALVAMAGPRLPEAVLVLVGLGIALVASGLLRAPRSAAAGALAAVLFIGPAMLLGIPPLWAGPVGTGAAITHVAPHPTDSTDLILGALLGFSGAALLGATIGLVHPAGVPGAIALGAVAGILPAAWRHDHPRGPEHTRIRTLPEAYRAPAMVGARLFDEASAEAPDVPTRRRLAELAVGVVDLQERLASLDVAADALDVERQVQRASRTEPGTQAHEHAQRMIRHYSALDEARLDVQRLIEASLDHLEEARIAFTVGRVVAGWDPAHLQDLLARVRQHARDAGVRQATHRELAALERRPSAV